MEKNNYIQKENSYEGKKTNLKDTKLEGLEIKPKNHLAYDAVEVNSLTIVNQKYIEKLLRKKIKRKLDYFLNYIISIIDGDDETENPENLQLALDDLAHYRSIIEYKYRKFLDEKYVNLLLQKIEMLEHEIKRKLVYVTTYHEEKEILEEKGKTR
jgi:hypothetical protein